WAGERTSNIERRTSNIERGGGNGGREAALQFGVGRQRALPFDVRRSFTPPLQPLSLKGRRGPDRRARAAAGRKRAVRISGSVQHARPRRADDRAASASGGGGYGARGVGRFGN